MYCPSCGYEIAVELKYCNRCGANLSVPTSSFPSMIAAPPVKLTIPSIVLGLTVTVSLGIIVGAATKFAEIGLHPFAIIWIVLFSTATLFGITAMLIRFWTKMLTLQRDTIANQPMRQSFVEKPAAHQLPPPRLEGVASVTENTTRTFSPIYREPSDGGTR